MGTESTVMTTSQGESLPFFDQLLLQKNTVEFSLSKSMDLRSVSDADDFVEEPKTTTGHDFSDHDHEDHKNVFCGGMMMMTDQEMAHHGVASMQMSKGGMVM
jgi:hypothetical protein